MDSEAAQFSWVDAVEAEDEMGWSESEPAKGGSDAGIEGELVGDDGGG